MCFRHASGIVATLKKRETAFINLFAKKKRSIGTKYV